MRDGIVPAAFKNIEKPLNIGLDVGVRVLQRIPNPGLRRQMHDPVELFAQEYVAHDCTVGYVSLDEAKAIAAFDLGEPGLFEPHIVIGIEVIDADHLIAAREQSLCGVKADEASGAGQENFHTRRPDPILCSLIAGCVLCGLRITDNSIPCQTVA